MPLAGSHYPPITLAEVIFGWVVTASQEVAVKGPTGNTGNCPELLSTLRHVMTMSMPL
jgi:hypothetical protein